MFRRSIGHLLIYCMIKKNRLDRVDGRKRTTKNTINVRLSDRILPIRLFWVLFLKTTKHEFMPPTSPNTVRRDKELEISFFITISHSVYRFSMFSSRIDETLTVLFVGKAKKCIKNRFSCRYYFLRKVDVSKWRILFSRYLLVFRVSVSLSSLPDLLLKREAKSSLLHDVSDKWKKRIC